MAKNPDSEPASVLLNRCTHSSPTPPAAASSSGLAIQGQTGYENIPLLQFVAEGNQ